MKRQTRPTVRLVLVLLLPALTWPVFAATPEAPTAHELVEAAIDLTRGVSSYSELSMKIHRAQWERSSRLKAWTNGRKDALIRFTAPARDAGNATLKRGESMWTFTPKLNRVIRLPFSLMSQSWAGSDFSYNDLSRTDILLTDYDLEIVDTRTDSGHTVYVIEAVPHYTAPVVWGKEVLELRDDYVLLAQTFYDQVMQPVKRMEALEIGERGGRTFATRSRISKVAESDEWTEVEYVTADFDVALDSSLFTVFALESGREP